MTTLSPDQKVIADNFIEFLTSPDHKEMIITGHGGCGKSFLISFLSNIVLKEYYDLCKMLNLEPVIHSVELTATTNKAAAVLAENIQQSVNTIHSLLGLQIYEDYQTGEVKLSLKKDATIKKNMLIFIDEASMIDRSLLKLIRTRTQNCKIVYVGDAKQLAPVKENTCPAMIKGGNTLFYKLTTNIRSAGQPAILALCQQLRDTVETGEFKPIQLVPGVIDQLEGKEAEDEIKRVFGTSLNPDTRIIAFSNKRVIEFNNYIRELRKLPENITKYENLVVNTPNVTSSNNFLYSEQEITICNEPREDKITHLTIANMKGLFLPDIEFEIVTDLCEVRDAHTKQSLGMVHIPRNMEHVFNILKYFQKTKQWAVYFTLKELLCDIRPKDACTIHKIQGSTVDTIYIDAEDISKCRFTNMVARLLYVACSRAKNRIVFLGKLKQTYGGLVK